MTNFKKELNDLAKLLKENKRTVFGYNLYNTNDFVYNPHSYFCFSNTQEKIIILYFEYVLNKYSRNYKEERSIKKLKIIF